VRACIAVRRKNLLRQAEAATKRIKIGQALRVLDGVPLAVKDQVDMAPYPTTTGAAFLGIAAVTEDPTAVTRFRSVGALLIGKTNMHWIGIRVANLNLVHRTPRNPSVPNERTRLSDITRAASEKQLPISPVHPDTCPQ
jgi:Asp-tRNA(Asn)/Glu-tRNA(Gln) amidotransferase A subunit family amidase